MNVNIYKDEANNYKDEDDFYNCTLIMLWVISVGNVFFLFCLFLLKSACGIHDPVNWITGQISLDVFNYTTSFIFYIPFKVKFTVWGQILKKILFECFFHISWII